MAHYPGPFYEGPMGDWTGDLPVRSQRDEARERLGLPPWDERHGNLDPQLEFHGLPQFLRHHRGELDAVIRRRRGFGHPRSR